MEMLCKCIIHLMGRPLCVQVQAGDFTAKKEIVPLERRGAQDGAAILSFDFRKQLFEYDEASHSFSKLAFPVEVNFAFQRQHACTAALLKL